MKNYTSIAEIQSALVRTVNELINANNQAFYAWQSEKGGNDLFLSDPDRADRIHEAAEDGCDGSTHAEHIEDFTEYAGEYYSALKNAAWRIDMTDEQGTALDKEIETSETALTEDLARLELWHENAGSFHHQVG